MGNINRKTTYLFLAACKKTNLSYGCPTLKVKRKFWAIKSEHTRTLAHTHTILKFLTQFFKKIK